MPFRFFIYRTQNFCANTHTHAMGNHVTCCNNHDVHCATRYARPAPGPIVIRKYEAMTKRPYHRYVWNAAPSGAVLYEYKVASGNQPLEHSPSTVVQLRAPSTIDYADYQYMTSPRVHMRAMFKNGTYSKWSEGSAIPPYTSNV